MADDLVTITVSRRTIEFAINCLETAAIPPERGGKEPERYREWYTEAADELRRTGDG